VPPFDKPDPNYVPTTTIPPGGTTTVKPAGTTTVVAPTTTIP